MHSFGTVAGRTANKKVGLAQNQNKQTGIQTLGNMAANVYDRRVSAVSRTTCDSVADNKKANLTGITVQGNYRQKSLQEPMSRGLVVPK